MSVCISGGFISICLQFCNLARCSGNDQLLHVTLVYKNQRYACRVTRSHINRQFFQLGKASNSASRVTRLHINRPLEYCMHVCNASTPCHNQLRKTEIDTTCPTISYVNFIQICMVALPICLKFHVCRTNTPFHTTNISLPNYNL